MANKQIPNLPAAISLNGTEQLEAVQAGVSVRVTSAQIASLVPNGPTGPTGAASTVAGPTGPTGPTGAASTVAGPTGPTGPTGAASTVAGPTGPTGPGGSSTYNVLSNTTTTSPLAWNSNNYDEYIYTALANDLTLSADAGSPTDGKKIIFNITDNGTPRVITFTGGVSKGFQNIGTGVATSGSNFTYTTTANKKVYFGCIYESADARWDIVALSQEL